MRRTGFTLAAFALSFGGVLAATGWISAEVLRLDRAQAAAHHQAALDENVRLALWRMDSALAPLISRESARPYFAYAAFYPAERAYGRMFSRVEEGEALSPSPLLEELPERVLLHFQLDPAGRVTSPQVPPAEERRVHRRAGPEARVRLAEITALFRGRRLAGLAPAPSVPAPAPAASSSGFSNAPANVLVASKGGSEIQAQKNELEWQARNRNAQLNVYQQQAVQQLSLPPVPGPSAGVTVAGGSRPPKPVAIGEGAFAPAWIEGRLFLLRRVSVGGAEYVQGCWLDWPSIAAWLQAEVKDLLPHARLGASGGGAPGDGQLLATLPVRLFPGPMPIEERPASTTRAVLAVAWAGVFLSGAAVLALLLGTLALSERRSIFVSAVTHELRTPLTTFQLYSEMLAEGMVKDDAQRRSYLETLRAEAARLGHLVENVLAYGRLERARPARRREPVALGELLQQSADRLAERAARAGMTLSCEPPAEEVWALTDASAVDQILVNLVENACKYAAAAPDRRIHLSARREERRAEIRVRDRGPGIPLADRRRLFRPFSRSAERAAGSAPGVGLGLALCRKLARSLGGSLRLESSGEPGACFVLGLPLDEAGANGR